MLKHDYCQKVAEGIYIGSVESAKNAPAYIDAIVDLSGVKYNTTIPSLHILMLDEPITLRSVELVIEKFTAGAKFIRNERSRGNNVLVHCAAGINRSATLIGMYLINSGWTYDQVLVALTTANNARMCPVLTNESFRLLLATYSALHTNKI